MDPRTGIAAPGTRDAAVFVKRCATALAACMVLALHGGMAWAQPSAWQAQMRSPQPMERAQAALAAAQAQDRSSIGLLRELLARDTQPNVRAAAALALGCLQDTTSTPAIASLLQGGSGIGSDIVIDALVRMGDARGAVAVLPLLDADDDVLRLQVVDALVQLQAQSLGPQVLQRAQANRDPAKAKTYAMALGKLQVRQSQDYLLNLARHSEPSPTRWASYLALGRIRSEAATDLLVDALAAPFEKGRENAQQALTEIASGKAAPKLWPLLQHGERSVRFAAAEVLVGLKHAGTDAALLAALDKPQSQAAAALALGKRKVAAAREPIQAALVHTDASEREVLAQALGWLGDQRATAVLRHVLVEPAGEGRYGAAWSLGVLRAREARDELQRAASGSDNRLALIALDALGMLADPASADFLARQAQSNPAQALGALTALAQVPGDPARKALESMVLHKDDRVARAALQGLAQRKDAASVPALLDALDRVAVDNRKAVHYALTAITGQRWSTPTQWRQWYAAAPR